MTTSFPRLDLAHAFRQLGPAVGPLPSALSGPQLLWGISGVESSFGEDCTPRHEPAFDKGGHYSNYGNMPALLARYGSAAACSYGPLQIMFCNAPATYTPDDFGNLMLAAQASVVFLNRQLRVWKPQTLVEIGEIWNAGREVPDPDYTVKLVKAYATPIPT